MHSESLSDLLSQWQASIQWAGVYHS